MKQNIFNSKPKPKRLAGVVITPSQIKIIGFTRGLQTTVLEHVYEHMEEKELTAEGVKQFTKSLPKPFLKDRLFFVIIPDEEMVTQSINLPIMSESDLSLAIEHQINATSEVLWDKDKVGAGVVDKETMNRFLVYSVKKEKMNRLLMMFQAEDILIEGVIPYPRLYGALIGQEIIEADPDEHQINIDLADNCVKFSIVKGKKLVFYRHISTQLKSYLDHNKAESETMNEESSNEDEQINLILKEIKDSISFYQQKHEGVQFNKLMVWGYFLSEKSVLQKLNILIPALIPQKTPIQLTLPKLKTEKLEKEAQCKVDWPKDEASMDYDALTIAMALSIDETIASSRLLPELFRYRWVQSLSLWIMIIGFPVIMLFLIGSHFKYENLARKMSQKIAKERGAYSKLEKQFKVIQEEAKRSTTRTAQMNALKKHLVQKRPVSELMVALSQLQSRELYEDQLSTIAAGEAVDGVFYIEKIQVVNQNIKIDGSILSKYVAPVFTTYLSGIRKLPYIHQVNYQVKPTNDKQLSKYTVTALFTTTDQEKGN